MRVGHAIQIQPLLWCTHAGRHAHADHERIGRLQLLLAALLTQVPIVLLIAAVKLEQCGVVLRDRAGDGVGKALLDRAAQVIAVVLDDLDAGALCFGIVVHMQGIPAF